MSETAGRDGPRGKGRGRMAEGLGWVGRCHFRYSMEPALCEHVGNTARTGGAIKKMMSGKSRNYTRLTRRRLVL